MSGMLLALVTSTRHPNADPHQSAMALQLAMSEARGLALTNGSVAPGAIPTGATVLVAVDPSDATKSVISVYVSRPIATGNGPADGAPSSEMTPELGRPPVVVPGRFTVTNGSASMADTFAITVGASGVVDFVPGYRVGAAAGAPLVACDPGATIGVAVGASSERHAIACQDGVYDANAWPPSGEPRDGNAP